MRKLFFVSLILCCLKLSTFAEPITIQLTDWRFVVDSRLNFPNQFQFSMNGVGSDGKTFHLSGIGQGGIPGTNQPNGFASVNFAPFEFSYGDVSLFSPGQCCPSPPFYPNLVGGITFSPTTPPAGGDPRNITSILSFTQPAGLVLLDVVPGTAQRFEVGVLSFSLTGAAIISGSTGPNDPLLKMVTSGTGGTAILTLSPQADVPEPATLLLLGSGLAGLAWRRRAKRIPS